MTSQQSPKTVGRYQIVRPLGAGAMGEVFLALDPNIDRYLAIKTVRLTGPINEVEDRKQRLLREAKAAGRLLHPNVVTLFDAGEHEGLLYLAFEYVEGQDLSHRMIAEPPLTLGEILRLAREVASALEIAHVQGIVHRDIKPSNLLIGLQGEAKIADFGIAKLAGAATQLTQTGSVVGSPQYMSPEQIRGEALDGRSDLFSLGVVLYELLGQRRPFDGDTLSTLVFQILSQEPPAIDQLHPPVPQRLGQLVHRLLAKAPVDRPTAGELMREIDALQGELSVAQLALPMVQIEATDGVPGATQINRPTTQLPPPIPGMPPVPPPMPVAAPLPDADSAGTYAVPASRGRRIPLLLTGIAALLIAAGWLGTQFFSEDQVPSGESAIVSPEPRPVEEEDPLRTSEDSSPASAGVPGPPVGGEGSSSAAEGPGSQPDADESISAPAPATVSDLTPSASSAGASTPPDLPSPSPPTSSNSPSSSQIDSPPPQVESLKSPPPPPPIKPPQPSSPSPPPPSPPPPSPPPSSAAPPSAPASVVPDQPPVRPPGQRPDPAIIKFDRAAELARLELGTGLRLRFDIEPDDAIVKVWKRGDRRSIVQGDSSRFKPNKKNAKDLELNGEGEYLIGLFRDGLPEAAILIHASASHGTQATVIRSNLRQNRAAGPRLVVVGRAVAFRGEPRNAIVHVDGAEVGPASRWPGAPRPGSPQNLSLSPGVHTLRLEAPGFKPYEVRVEVRSGREVRKRLIEYRLQPERNR